MDKMDHAIEFVSKWWRLLLEGLAVLAIVVLLLTTLGYRSCSTTNKSNHDLCKDDLGECRKNRSTCTTESSKQSTLARSYDKALTETENTFREIAEEGEGEASVSVDGKPIILKCKVADSGSSSTSACKKCLGMSEKEIVALFGKSFPLKFTADSPLNDGTPRRMYDNADKHVGLEVFGANSNPTRLSMCIWEYQGELATTKNFMSLAMSSVIFDQLVDASGASQKYLDFVADSSSKKKAKKTIGGLKVSISSFPDLGSMCFGFGPRE